QDGATDEQRSRVGSGLYNVLFPAETDDGKKAQQAFDEFVQAHTGTQTSVSAMPSIFVRMIGPDAESVLVPFGITAVHLGDNTDFIGNRFRVEMPLAVQSYVTQSRPLTRWFVVAPEASRTDELGTARKAAEAAFANWEDHVQRSFPDMSQTFDWIGKRGEEREGSALVVLSHHDSDRLYFDKSDSLSADNITLTFRRPAVAILDGCGTGAAAGTLIKDLNTHGFDAIIATATPVSPRMAGDFLVCLSDTLEKNRAAS